MSPASFFQRTSDDKRVAFLTELLRGADASQAAARANLNRGSVYRWKLTDPEFAAVWEEIVARRPRRRQLRRRVLKGAGVFESSQMATPAARPAPSLESLWDNDFDPTFEA